MIKQLFKCYRPVDFNSEDDVTLLDTPDQPEIKIIDLTENEDDEDVIIIDTPQLKVSSKDEALKKEHVNTPQFTPEPELTPKKKTSVDTESFGFNLLEDQSVSTKTPDRDALCASYG